MLVEPLDNDWGTLYPMLYGKSSLFSYVVNYKDAIALTTTTSAPTTTAAPTTTLPLVLKGTWDTSIGTSERNFAYVNEPFALLAVSFLSIYTSTFTG